jgi:hypothetical protein
MLHFHQYNWKLGLCEHSDVWIVTSLKWKHLSVIYFITSFLQRVTLHVFGCKCTLSMPNVTLDVFSLRKQDKETWPKEVIAALVSSFHVWGGGCGEKVGFCYHIQYCCESHIFWTSKPTPLVFQVTSILKSVRSFIKLFLSLFRYLTILFLFTYCNYFVIILLFLMTFVVYRRMLCAAV